MEFVNYVHTCYGTTLLKFRLNKLLLITFQKRNITTNKPSHLSVVFYEHET